MGYLGLSGPALTSLRAYCPAWCSFERSSHQMGWIERRISVCLFHGACSAPPDDDCISVILNRLSGRHPLYFARQGKLGGDGDRWGKCKQGNRLRVFVGAALNGIKVAVCYLACFIPRLKGPRLRHLFLGRCCLFGFWFIYHPARTGRRLCVSTGRHGYAHGWADGQADG
jgi:hypothetical protein